MLIMELLMLALFVIVGSDRAVRRRGCRQADAEAAFTMRRFFSLSTVAGATSIAVLSFLGFDGISTLSEESRGGKNAVGRATVLSLLLVGALFMLQTWIATDLARGMHFDSPETAFYEIAHAPAAPGCG